MVKAATRADWGAVEKGTKGAEKGPLKALFSATVAVDARSTFPLGN